MNDHLSYFSFGILDELGIINAYTTKKSFDFDFHTKSDDELKAEQTKLENFMNQKFETFVLPRQNHTDKIAIIDETNKDQNPGEVDGVLTNLSNVALGTISADCQNLYFYDQVEGVIGCVHSGWRGTYQQIARKTIEKMQEVYQSDPADIIVCIGPSILKCCFEVDADVMLQFQQKFGEKYISLGEMVDGKQKYHIDTIEINKDELMELGVLEQNIYLSNICTRDESDIFFSCRGQGNGTGRNLALICKK